LPKKIGEQIPTIPSTSPLKRWPRSP